MAYRTASAAARRGRVKGAWLSADKEEGVFFVDILGGQEIVKASIAGAGQRAASGLAVREPGWLFRAQPAAEPDHLSIGTSSRK